MLNLKISLITVCYNAEKTIRRCIESVAAQNYPNLEYIVIDGQSTDNTARIIAEYMPKITKLISEPDNGLYDALNKGLALATGDVVGILNADDFFIHDRIVSTIAQAFGYSGADIVYGNLNFVNQEGKVVRRWTSGMYKPGMFKWGWMPPHPTFYAKRKLFEQYGNYRLDYGSAADYELMMRFMHNQYFNIYYLNETFLHMQTGGISNKSLLNRVKVYRYDYKTIRNNNIKFPLLVLLLKPLRKVFQYF